MDIKGPFSLGDSDSDTDLCVIRNEKKRDKNTLLSTSANGPSKSDKKRCILSQSPLLAIILIYSILNFYVYQIAFVKN